MRSKRAVPALDDFNQGVGDPEPIGHIKYLRNDERLAGWDGGAGDWKLF